MPLAWPIRSRLRTAALHGCGDIEMARGLVPLQQALSDPDEAIARFEVQLLLPVGRLMDHSP